MIPILKVKLLNEKATLPTRSGLDAGIDLYSSEDVCLRPFRDFVPWTKVYPPPKEYYEVLTKDYYRALVSTGISVEFSVDNQINQDKQPYGMGVALLIWDRSGLSSKHGIHRLAGVIDSSFRGEIKVALVNLSTSEYQIKVGDRIAQALLSPIYLPEIVQVSELSETQRGDRGFGSSGK